MTMYIQAHDLVKAIGGQYKGRKGYVVRVKDQLACVVFENYWSFGVWVNMIDLKRFKKLF